MEDVEIDEGTIRLGQLLKLAGLVENGGEAKSLIQDGEVMVNELPETRRGRQLSPGDRVSVGSETVRVTSA
ncbi:ribosome-associated protein [Actinopolyspora xinjiangensis]|uniref:Ribosome-associated protein n=1 Tax=Actinopolyspora xinjiangensis TaxID=405564 RepID=A0A1H0S053_9ACTN|nr:RNA-binding S4 domain-containing protein [Actinopolyspora xinjiangensis]SDP34997.1 ribosome-associated protein [Actinopolyspora xinjiangensis]